MNKKLIILIFSICIIFGIIVISIFILQSKQNKKTQDVIEHKVVKENVDELEISKNNNNFQEANAVKEMKRLGYSINNQSIGDSIDLKRVLMKINGASESSSFFDELGNKEYKAKNGAKFVFVNLSITNQEKSSFYMPEEGVQLIDNLGREYNRYHSTYVYKLSDSIEEELQPGIEQTGVLVFELPVSSESYALLTSSTDRKMGFLVPLK